LIIVAGSGSYLRAVLFYLLPHGPCGGVGGDPLLGRCARGRVSAFGQYVQVHELVEPPILAT
jgi:hypothetical protein